MNLGYVFAHGDGVLVSVFMLLIGMSLLSWYLIFWKDSPAFLKTESSSFRKCPW